MTAKSTMEELRELNVRRQREAQIASQNAAAETPDPPSFDKMIILSNDIPNDHTNIELNELLNTQTHEDSSLPTHEDVGIPLNEEAHIASQEFVARRPAPGKGRVSKKPALSATDRLFAQTAREPVMRLNIELTESMHTQLKQYCVLHKIPIRLLVTALIEDFLTKETEGA